MTIKVSMAAAVAGGETLSDAVDLDVAAYTSMSGTVVDKGGLLFSLQPDAGEKVRLLFLTAEKYGDLTYSIQSANTNPTAALGLELNEPQLLIGDTVKAVEPSPHYLAFWNAGDESINVKVMVGRDAIAFSTPPPTPVPVGPMPTSRRPTSAPRTDIAALERDLEKAKKDLADAEKAKVGKGKLLQLNQDVEAIQIELEKARTV